MLTRDLLIFRRVKGGNLRPTFIDASDETHVALASELVQVLAHGLGETRAALEEALEVHIGEAKKPKVARGLVKLLLDRCEFEEPGETAAELRAKAFAASATALRELAAEATMAEFWAAVEQRLPVKLDVCREALFADLAGERKLIAHDLPTAAALLDRYNLAQAQGLAVYAQRLRVATDTRDPLELRKLLRWLKFSRLVASVHREDDTWHLVVEGPGAILDMQKKYGLQLANFLAAVPLLSKFTLEADVTVPRGASGTMVLSHKDPLRALDRSALGHIPPEIDAGLGELAEAPWSLDLLPALRHTGVSGMCVPDFGMVHADGLAVAVELFHRWHHHALLRRLDELDARTDPTLLLGVDLSLTKAPAIAARVHDHPQVFTFNKFPARRRLHPLLARLLAASAGTARAQAAS